MTIHVPLGPTHRAEHETHLAAEFACPCGYRARARARAVGEGAAKNPLFLDAEATDRAAHRRAVSDALNRAEALLQIVPCPKCGRRNPAGVRSFIAWSVIPATGLAFVSFMLGGAAAGMSAGGLAVGVLAALVAVGVYSLRRHSLWGRADHDVEFIDVAAKRRRKRRDSTARRR